MINERACKQGSSASLMRGGFTIAIIMHRWIIAIFIIQFTLGLAGFAIGPLLHHHPVAHAVVESINKATPGPSLAEPVAVSAALGHTLSDDIPELADAIQQPRHGELTTHRPSNWDPQVYRLLSPPLIPHPDRPPRQAV